MGMLQLLFAVLCPVAQAEPTLREATVAAGLRWPPPDLSVHIDKSDRQLTVQSGATVVKRYPVALGDPAGDKLVQGDRKTPTGTLYVVTRNDKSQFHLFLGLGYPNAEDADRGLAAGLINAATAERIRQAERARRQPPWETALGGAVGIHGGGTGVDWTLGCVALEDAAIEELWSVAPIGTRVIIEE